MRTPTVKWEVYIKKYGSSCKMAHSTGVQFTIHVIGSLIRIYLRPDFRSVSINGSLALFFTLLWGAFFVRVHRVPVGAPTLFGSTP